MPVSVNKTPVPPPAARKLSRLPVFLSFAFPGVGQMAQKRWVCGVLFFVATVIALVFFIIESCLLMYRYYSLMFGAVFEPPSPRAMLTWLGAILVVYILAVWDANESFKRSARKQNRDRMEARLQETLRTAVTPPPLPSDDTQGLGATENPPAGAVGYEEETLS